MSKPRAAYPSRTRASLTLVAFLLVLLGSFTTFAVWAHAQPSSGWEDTNPIENWHLPSDGSDILGG